MSSLLIRNGTIVSMGPLGIVDPGAIFIEDSRIATIGANKEVVRGYARVAKRTIDATGMIILPGLIDAHYHTLQQFYRDLTALMAQQGKEILSPHWKNYLVPFEASLSPTDVYYSALAAYTNMLRVGTTFVSEHGGRYPKEMARAMEKVGIRGLLAISTMDMDPTPPPLPKNMLFDTTEEAIKENLAIVEQWPFRGEGLVRGVFSLRQIIVCTRELIQKTVALAEKHHTLVQTHLNEGTYELEFARAHYGARPAEFLEQLYALSSHLIVAHFVLASDREVELLGERGVGVVHCPTGNFAMGLPKLPLMRRVGINIGLGSDGANGGTIDLFEKMRFSLGAQRSHFGAPYQDQSVTSPLEVLEMATIGGARVVGLDKEIGSLEMGKRADLICLDKTGLHTLPGPDPVLTVVKCLSGADVKTVVINGQVVMEEGTILTVDEKELKKEVAARAKHLQERFLEELG